MAKIIFDIETAGEDFDKMDETTQKMLTRYIKDETVDEDEYNKKLEDIKNELVFSPLTSQVVAVGVFDDETDKGAVYFQAPDEKIEEFEEEGIKYKPMDEKEILKNFWKVAKHADEFVSFNGRGFDVPFLMIRSAIHKIKPSKNLLSNRYLNLQRNFAKHVDLMDQLTFYGAVWKRPSLHMTCRAFGIKSPKEEGVSGDDVTRLFKEKKYLDIAKYNARDLRSTRELYNYWDKYLRF